MSRRPSLETFFGSSAWAMTKRTLLTVFGLQVLLALALTLVDSYRRRGKKPKPFPTTEPATVQIGDGVDYSAAQRRQAFPWIPLALQGLTQGHGTPAN